MATTKIRLTSRSVNGLPVPTSGHSIAWDTELKGYGCRVMPTGLRTYFVQVTKGGRQFKRKVGRADRMTADQARAAAGKLIFGELPERKAKTVATPDAPQTLGELWQRHEQEHLPTLRPGSRAQYSSVWRCHLEQHGAKRLDQLTRAMVEQLHREVSAHHGKVAANHAARLLKGLYNRAELHGWASGNPARGVRLHREHGRELFLPVAKIREVQAILRAGGTLTDKALELLFLTGCRRGEALAMTWSDVDLEQGLWIKRASYSKDGRVHRLPLSDEAVALLASIERTGVRVFHGLDKNRLTRRWAVVRKQAGVPECRLHDARHSFPSKSPLSITHSITYSIRRLTSPLNSRLQHHAKHQVGLVARFFA
jgi:integrase